MSVNGPDERDPNVDAAWRGLPDASPPPDLDDSIRAAARRAVHAKPSGSKARAPWPAWMTFAAAASIGVVAIGVWKMMPQEDDALHATTSDVPVTARPAAPTAANAPKPATAAVPTPASAPSQSTTVPADSVSGGASRDAAPAAAPASIQTAPHALTAPAAPPRVPAEEPARAAQPTAATVSAAPAAPIAPAAPSNADASPSAGAPASSSGFVPAPPPSPPASDAAKPVGSDTAKRAGAVARAVTPFPGTTQNAPVVAGRAEAPQSEAAKTARAAAPADAKTAADTAAAPSPTVAGSVTDNLARSFDDYVLAIRRALDAKRDDDAVKELRALRKAYPDADERMPVDLRSWAFRVRK